MPSHNGPSEGKVTALVSDAPDPGQRELARLRRENERLGQRLADAEAAIEIQKEVFASVKSRRARGETQRALLMASATELVPVVGVTAACQALGIGRASFYRHARR